MGLYIALARGAFGAETDAAPLPSPPIVATDIAGRWTGNHYSYGAARAKCSGSSCKLTIDVSACADGWCGVLVKDGGACSSLAMKVKTGSGKDNYLRFDGKLELDPKAASYTVQATLWRDETGKPHLDFIGDTGPELMFMRRSFPFQARLARTGDAACTSDKATS